MLYRARLRATHLSKLSIRILQPPCWYSFLEKVASYLFELPENTHTWRKKGSLDPFYYWSSSKIQDHPFSRVSGLPLYPSARWNFVRTHQLYSLSRERLLEIELSHLGTRRITSLWTFALCGVSASQEGNCFNKIEGNELAHCGDCALSSNLWLCLTCGYLGCGRK